MGDPKPPLPDEFKDPQIDHVIGSAELTNMNHVVDGVVSAGNVGRHHYREPADLEAHNALRNAMLEQYYCYKDERSHSQRKRLGENFEPAADLSVLLQQIKVVTDEWHRDLGPEDDPAIILRNESVNALELPLIQSLSIRVNEIPEQRRGEVMALLEDYVTVGDDKRAKKEALDIIGRLRGE